MKGICCVAAGVFAAGVITAVTAAVGAAIGVVGVVPWEASV